MIISERLAPYVVYYEDSIQAALQKINTNTRRLVFCLSEFGVLEGLVTDGDFRRWVVQVDNIDLTRPVREIANRRFIQARDSDSPQYIESLLSARITAVPLIDTLGRLTAIAWSGAPGIRFADWEIRDDKPAFLIAEIGNNHNGSLDLAKRLIEAAAEAGANCAKFQLRDMDSLYGNGGRLASEDLGTEYTLDLLERFQLSVDEMFEALDHVRACGLIPLCTPWDLVSLERLVQYGIDAIKIASADLTNHQLLMAAAQTRKPLLISTGMSLEHEINEAVQLLRAEAAQFVLLQCNSTYPVPMRDINLAYMDRLGEIAQGPVGYSGHELGYEVCIAAVARGARVIEKHFTLDRNMEGNDHRVSLLPAEFGAMVRAIRNVEDAIGTCDTRTLTQGERLNREVLAKSLVAGQDIRKGELIAERMVVVRSPGRGLQPSRMKDLLGVAVPRDMRAGDAFFESDIHGYSVQPRAYAFDRPWGIPVRYHDCSALTENCTPDLVEIHMSYRDLELDPGAYFKAPGTAGLVVHSPELFAGDHVMDLSAADERYRLRSIQELQRVIDRTRQLKRYFPATERPLVIINAGGFTLDRFLPVEERRAGYARIASSLAALDSEGVEIIPQTMPPFPWHFGGQRFHNLFMDPAEISEFCVVHGFRVCFDSSHAKLACNYFGWSMRDYLRQIGPYVAHLHLVDARGHHDEGLQIGAGEIDFGSLGEDLRTLAPGISFIPEIWQGHKNSGEGFWLALDRLEPHLRGHDVPERAYD
ncbi:N-acetylneuraminate synthase family protein [Stutzerimonas stutzeri]|uniref:N-acetylneuraminate synthase family protein n=1 Tax=Stutzerimonas stutzeri TaxID=316 RepID=UPI001CFC6E5E|nr:N-acetylneuraminate synthase family protein [Stutzerimonas stutzeri]